MKRQKQFIHWVGWGGAIVAVLIACGIVLGRYQHQTRMMSELHARQGLKLSSAAEHIEHYLDGIWTYLQLVSGDPNVLKLDPGSQRHLHRIYEITYSQHSLAEVRVIGQGLEAERRPFLTFRAKAAARQDTELRPSGREPADYAVQTDHLRRFAEDPSLQYLISKEVLLSIGEPGLVCSVPIRLDGHLAGIVAGLLPSKCVSRILDRSSIDNNLLLASEHGSMFCCKGLPSEMRSWFQEQFGARNVGQFLQTRGQFSHVGRCTLLWQPVEAGGRQKWYVAQLYDESAYLPATGLASAGMGWGSAGLVLMLGGALVLLCRITPEMIDARRQAESRARELVEREAMTRALVDTAADGIVTIDAEGTITSFNAAAERIFGYAAGEVIGRKLTTLMPPHYASRHAEYIARYLRTGQGQVIGDRREVEGRRKDGSMVPVEVSVGEARIGDRRLFTGIIRDITERKRAQEAVQLERDRLMSILETTQDGVCVFDRECNIQYVNPVIRREFGPVDGRKCHEYFEDRTEPCPWCNNKDVVAGKAMQGEWYSSRNDHYYAMFDAPFKNPDGSFAKLAIFHDITDRKRAEERTRQHQEELAHAMRLGTMGEMAAGLAHELNQYHAAILNYIDACSERIRSGRSDPSGILEDLEHAAAEAERAAEVIDHTRDLIRKREPCRSLTDINTLVESAANWLKAEAGRNKVRIIFELGQAMPGVVIDAIQIEQVVMNLMRNAFDAVSQDSAYPRELAVRTAVNDEGLVELTFRDTGPGLTAEAIDRVFEPFYTTKSYGMGMGLAISRTIVESHGGRLWVVPNADRGVTFGFTLPVPAPQTSTMP